VPTASAGLVTAAPELGPPGPGAAAGASDAAATATSDDATAAAAARILSLRVAAISLASFSLGLSIGRCSIEGRGRDGRREKSTELACWDGTGRERGSPGLYIAAAGEPCLALETRISWPEPHSLAGWPGWLNFRPCYD
jgi:hypothetical protein